MSHENQYFKYWQFSTVKRDGIKNFFLNPQKLYLQRNSEEEGEGLQTKAAVDPHLVFGLVYSIAVEIFIFLGSADIRISCT